MRVFKYGCLEPIENLDLVRDQFRRAHEYRNRLIEVERWRRDEIRKLQLADPDVLAAKTEFDAVSAEYAEAVETLRADRKEVRSRQWASAKALEDAKHAKEMVKVKKKIFFSRLSELKKTERYQVEQERINEEARTKNKTAGGESGVAWGTKQLHQMAMYASAKSPLWDGAEPSGPKFLRWDGTGSIGVQVIHGMLATELISGEHTQLQLGPGVIVRDGSEIRLRSSRPGAVPRASTAPATGGKRSATYCTFRIRIGTVPKSRQPIWTTVPMQLHRPIPAGARIPRASIYLRRRGPREIWSIAMWVDYKPDLGATSDNFVVADNGLTVRRLETPVYNPTGTVAIDLGWRLIGDQVRMAVWLDDSGQSGELRLSAEEIEAIRRPERLRSQRARNLEAIKTSLVDWIGNFSYGVPDWLVEETTTRNFDTTQSAARIAGLLEKWKESRFEGDSVMFDELVEWCRHDRHLWVYEVEQRAQGLARRDNTFYCFAAKLARKYSVLVLEDLDLSRLARSRSDEWLSAENNEARANRQRYAPGRLQQACIKAFSARNGIVRIVDSTGIGRTCANSGQQISLPVELYECACPCGCGRWLDKNFNAVAQILKLGMNSEKVKKTIMAENPDVGGRWRAIKEKREAKLQEMGPKPKSRSRKKKTVLSE